MGVISIKAKLEQLGYNVDAFDEGMLGAFRMAVSGLARAAKNEWVRIAQTKTATSRETYIGGLMQADSFKTSRSGLSDIYEISLVGNMANNFEFGMPSFDMKAVRPGWLGGGKAKTAKDGHKYIMIPFRHSTSDSPRFNYTGKAAAASAFLSSAGEPDLKQQLRKAVRQYGLDRMVRTSAGGAVISGPVKRLPRGVPVHPYLQGMTRVQQGVSGSTKAGPRGQGRLMTWRVMSEKSRPGSWIHPGLDALNLLPEVETWIDSQMGTIIEQIVGI